MQRASSGTTLHFHLALANTNRLSFGMIASNCEHPRCDSGQRASLHSHLPLVLRIFITRLRASFPESDTRCTPWRKDIMASRYPHLASSQP